MLKLQSKKIKGNLADKKTTNSARSLWHDFQDMLKYRGITWLKINCGDI